MYNSCLSFFWGCLVVQLVYPIYLFIFFLLLLLLSFPLFLVDIVHSFIRYLAAKLYQRKPPQWSQQQRLAGWLVAPDKTVRIRIRIRITRAMAMSLVLLLSLLLGLSLLDGSGNGGNDGINGARVLVRASRHLFSVQDDLLAFPQVRYYTFA